MVELGYRASSRPPDKGDGIFASREALLLLEEKPIAPKNTVALAVLRSSIDPTGKRASADDLEPFGFRYAGVRREAKGFFPATVYDVWVQTDRTTYALVRRLDVVESSRYLLRTFFSDGTCVETVDGSRADGTARGPLIERRGMDELERDLRDHAAAIRERVTDDVRILPVERLDDVARLQRFYVAYVISEPRADSIAQARLIQTMILVGVVVMLVFAYFAATAPPRAARQSPAAETSSAR